MMKKKLSFKEQKELEGLPGRIELIEAKLAKLHEAMADPSFFRRPPEAIASDQKQLEQLESELAGAFATWEELEARSAG